MAQDVSSTIDINVKVGMDIADLQNKQEVITNQFNAMKTTMEDAMKDPSIATGELIKDLDNLYNHLNSNVLSLEGIIPDSQFNAACDLVLGLDEEFNKLKEDVLSTSSATTELQSSISTLNIDKSIGENGGVMSELLKNSSFNATEESVAQLEQENAQRKALRDIISAEYDAMIQNEQAKKQEIDTSQILTEQYGALQSAVSSTIDSNNSLGSSTTDVANKTQEIDNNTSNISNNISSATDKTQQVSSISSGIDKSVTGIITGINQGLQLVEKVYGFIVDISDVAIEINQSLFEMSTLLGGDVADGVIEYTNAMQELYGLDGTTLVNQTAELSSSVAKMGLSTEDAIEVTSNLSDFAYDLGAVTGDFDKVFKDLAGAIDKGFIGRTSSLYNILTKEEISELKSFNTEAERYNYIMSKAGRAGGTFEKYLETSNGKIYLLGQSFESLKSNVAAFANAAYSSIAPVLTDILTGLNNILSKLMDIFNVSYKGFDYDGIANNFVDDASEIEEAAESANGSLREFDDILSAPNSNTDTSSSSALSGIFDSGIDTSDVNGAIDDTKSRLDTLVENFKDGWNEAWEAGKGDKAVADIKSNLASIKESLENIWTDPDVQNAANECTEQWSKTLGALTGAAEVTGANIAAGLTGGTAKWLDEDSEHIKTKIIDLANSSKELGAEVEQAADNFAEFSTVFNSDDFINMSASMDKLGFDITIESKIIGNKMATAIVSGFNSIWETAGPSIESAVESTFGSIGNIFDGFDTIVVGLGETIETWFNEKFIPFAEIAGEKIGGALTIISDFWETHISPALSGIGDKLTELWEEHMQPMFEKLSPYIDLVLQYVEVLLSGVGFVVKLLVGELGPTVEWLINDILGGVINIIGDICDLIGGFVDLILGIFTLDGDKIIDGLKEMGKAILNAIIDILNSLIGLVESTVTSILNNVSNIAGLFGIDMGFSINIPDIPKLATGGIINRESVFIGGEENYREAVVPLDRNTEWMDIIADKVGSRLSNNNRTNNNGNITIDMRNINSGYMTRADFLKMGELISKSLTVYGANVSVVK